MQRLVSGASLSGAISRWPRGVWLVGNEGILVYIALESHRVDATYVTTKLSPREGIRHATFPKATPDTLRRHHRDPKNTAELSLNRLTSLARYCGTRCNLAMSKIVAIGQESARAARLSHAPGLTFCASRRLSSNSRSLLVASSEAAVCSSRRTAGVCASWSVSCCIASLTTLSSGDDGDGTSGEVVSLVGTLANILGTLVGEWVIFGRKKRGGGEHNGSNKGLCFGRLLVCDLSQPGRMIRNVRLCDIWIKGGFLFPDLSPEKCLLFWSLASWSCC